MVFFDGNDNMPRVMFLGILCIYFLKMRLCIKSIYLPFSFALIKLRQT